MKNIKLHKPVKRKILLAILVLIVLVEAGIVSVQLFNAGQIGLQPLAEPDAEEYAVYSAFFRPSPDYVPERDRIYLVNGWTTHSSLTYGNNPVYAFKNIWIKAGHIMGIHEKIPVSLVGLDTLADYKLKNRLTWPLRYRLASYRRLLLVSREEFNELFDEYGEGGSYGELYKRYPGALGLYTFSRVGFNRSRDRAVVYLGQRIDDKAGGGYIVLLKKKNGRWNIDKSVCVWVS